MRKSLCSSVIVILLIYIFSIVASAEIKCDGKIKGFEWDDSTAIEVIDYNTESGCNIKYLLMKYKYIEEDRRLYAAFYMLENKISEEPLPSAVCVSVNNGEEIIAYSDASSEYDEEKFSLETGALTDDNNGMSMELNIVFKEIDYDSEVLLNVRFIDSFGKSSQNYEFNLKSKELLESESKNDKTTKSKKPTKAKSSAKAKAKKHSATAKKIKTTTKQETQMPTVIVTEEYNTYGDKVKKSNKTLITIGAVCLTGVLCGYIFMSVKNKKQK